MQAWLTNTEWAQTFVIQKDFFPSHVTVYWSTSVLFSLVIYAYFSGRNLILQDRKKYSLSSVRQGTTQRYRTSFRYSFFIGRKRPISSYMPPARLFIVCFVNLKKNRLSQLTYSLFLKFNHPKTHKNVYVTKPDMFWIRGSCTNPWTIVDTDNKIRTNEVINIWIQYGHLNTGIESIPKCS